MVSSLEVVVRLLSCLGSYANPVLMLRPVNATAEATDASALTQHGFRLTNLPEVALRYPECRNQRSGRALAHRLAGMSLLTGDSWRLSA